MRSPFCHETCHRSPLGNRYLSLGHKICLETAIAYVQSCLIEYRLPEPTRLVDKLSKL